MEPVSLGLLHDGDMSTYSSTCSSRKSSSQVSQDAEFFELFETINKCGLDMEQVMVCVCIVNIFWIVIFKIWNLKKTFDQFEDESSGTVELSVVPTLFRILNIQTSVESIEMAARQLGISRNNRTLDFETFVELSSQFISEEDKETTIYELKEAFR